MRVWLMNQSVSLPLNTPRCATETKGPTQEYLCAWYSSLMMTDSARASHAIAGTKYQPDPWATRIVITGKNLCSLHLPTFSPSFICSSVAACLGIFGPMASQNNPRGDGAVKISIALSVVGNLFVLMRLYARLVVVTKPGFEDLCLAVAMGFATAFTVLMKVQADNGLGMHEWVLTKGDLLRPLKARYIKHPRVGML